MSAFLQSGRFYPGETPIFRVCYRPGADNRQQRVDIRPILARGQCRFAVVTQSQLNTFGFLALYASVGMAAESTSYSYIEVTRTPLEPSDVQQIEALVLAENPALSSSPGIKDASPQQISRSGRSARVIWYPHFSSGGVEEAFQVTCQQIDTHHPWTCKPATIRRYLNIETQDFAVRLLCDTPPETALALIHATRPWVREMTPDHSVVADTALVILRQNDSFVVAWGSPDEDETVDLQAWLEDGGDPADPADWRIGPFLTRATACPASSTSRASM